MTETIEIEVSDETVAAEVFDRLMAWAGQNISQ
jgi:hypothetical protein